MTDSIASPGSPEKIAWLIIRHQGFVNKSCAAGSILATEGQAWRYLDEQLREVPWNDYLEAVKGDPCPPYTIEFTVGSLSADLTLQVKVTTLYDMGICEESRGGNETVWTLQHLDGEWRVVDVDYLMMWD